MIDIMKAVVLSLKDQMLIMVFAVICGLYYLLIKEQKAKENICSDIKELTKIVYEGNTLNAKAITLLEVLVHGTR